MKGPTLTQLVVVVVFLAQGALETASGEGSKPDEGAQPMPTDSLESQHNTQHVLKIVNVNPNIFPFCHSLSYFPNAPWKPGLVLEGGPCRPAHSMGCEGFGCGPGICFPVTKLNCCSKDTKMKGLKRTNSAKRFDITSLPARPPSMAAAPSQASAEIKPSKDLNNQSKASKVLKMSTKGPPKIDLELKVSDDLKASSDFVVSHSRRRRQRHRRRRRHRHHGPHRPWYNDPVRVDQPRLAAGVLPIEVRLPNPNYWRFQGYYPHFMRVKASWAINPTDMKNIHNYPEYQYIDVPFVQSKHRHHRRPPFIDFSDLSMEDEEIGDAIEEATHMKNKIKGPHEYKHEEDRKMVDNAEDSAPEDKKAPTSKPTQGSDLSPAKQEIGGLNLHMEQKEDEQSNYPEYATQFNTDRFWSNSVKQKVPDRRFEFRKPEKEGESAMFKDFKPEYPGFDLDNISKFETKGNGKKIENQGARKTHNVAVTSSSRRRPVVPSGEGIVVKSDSVNNANEIKSFV